MKHLFLLFIANLMMLLSFVFGFSWIQSGHAAPEEPQANLPLNYWPVADNYRTVSSYPNTAWTWNHLGLNPGKACPPYNIRQVGNSLAYWRDTSIPYNQDVAQADPDGNGLVNCYSKNTDGSGLDHEGVDIVAPGQTPVYAAANGTVYRINANNGNSVIEINHVRTINGTNYTWRVRYVHLLNNFPYGVGTSVQEGNIIGYVGDLNHVHFEVEGLQGQCWGLCITNPYGPNNLWIDNNNDGNPDVPSTVTAPPANQNLVRNPHFNNGTNHWQFWGDIDWALYSNILHFKRRATGNSGAIYQDLNYPAPNHAEFEITVQLGNSSSVPKSPHVFLRRSDSWSDSFSCVFTLPPNTPLQTFTIRGKTNSSWPNIRLEVWPDPPDGIPDVMMDTVNVQYRPDLTLNNTECIVSTPVPPTTIPTPPPVPTNTPTPTPTTIPSDPITLNAEPGYGNIQLSWNTSTSPDTHEYRLQRAVEGNEFITIGATVETTYFDEDTALQAGSTYCYYLDVLDAIGNILATSNTDCANLGELALWVPDVWAAPGQTAIVPVNIQNADDFQIAASDIWLDYDGTVLQTIAISQTALTADYTWTHNDLNLGNGDRRVKISAISNPPPILYGEGSLFWITFQVLGTDGNESILNLREFIQGVGGSTIYSPDNLYTPVSLVLLDGTFHVGSQYVLGDLNGNGVVEAVDAYIALDIADGRTIPTPEQKQAGDVNGNGRIDAADATMILYYATHGKWPPPELTMAQRAHVEGNPAPITFSLDDVYGGPGTVVQTYLYAEGLYSWNGGTFTIAYDPAVIDGITEVQVAGLTTDFDLDFYDNGTGLVQISMAGETSLSGSGIIAQITLMISSEAPSDSQDAVTLLHLIDIQINDLAGRDFATSALQQEIWRASSSVFVLASNQVFLPSVIR